MENTDTIYINCRDPKRNKPNNNINYYTDDDDDDEHNDEKNSFCKQFDMHSQHNASDYGTEKESIMVNGTRCAHNVQISNYDFEQPISDD